MAQQADLKKASARDAFVQFAETFCEREFGKLNDKHGLTLTGMYNVLEKLRAMETESGIKRKDRDLPSRQEREGGKGEGLSAKEREIHDKGSEGISQMSEPRLTGLLAGCFVAPQSQIHADMLLRRA